MGESGKTCEYVAMQPGKFMGAYYRAIDSKGRILLPPRFLEAISSQPGSFISSNNGQAENGQNARGSFWLTSLYGRVTAYLPATWQHTVAQLCAIKAPSRKLSNFKTRLIGMAEEIQPDAQGRIRVPQSLIREGALKKDIVLVGLLEKFEIWDQGLFDALPNEDVSEELAASGVDIFL